MRGEPRCALEFHHLLRDHSLDATRKHSCTFSLGSLPPQMATFEKKMESIKTELRRVKPELLKWHSEMKTLLSTSASQASADEVRARMLDSIY